MKKRITTYFNGEMSAAEEQEFQTWLAEHAEDPLVDGALEGLFDKCMKEPSRRRIFSLPLIISIAAALVALVAIPLSYRVGKVSGQEEYSVLLSEAESQTEQIRSVQWLEKTVPNGEVDTLLLSDGSCLYLNSGSRITYPSSFESSERRVFVDGEVFAKVAKDASRPFFVQSGDVTVKVLGTTFDFKAYGDANTVEACLLEGSVCLDVRSLKGDRQVMMKPGNRVQYDRLSGDVAINDFQLGLYKPFNEGRSLHFNNTSMEDIAKDLERAFGTKIVVMDEQLADTRFFAIFTNNESLDQILRAMNRNHKMNIARRDGVVYLSTAK